MLKWYIRIITVENCREKVEMISCYSYCQALKEAQKIWDAYSNKEKEAMAEMNFIIQKRNNEIVYQSIIEVPSIRLSVVLITTEAKNSFKKDEVLLECCWFWQSYSVVDMDNQNVLGCFDNYKQAKEAIHNYETIDKKNQTFKRERYQIQDKEGERVDWPRWITIWEILSHIDTMSMSMTDFSEKYGIPYRTLQNWYLEVNEPTDYLLGLIAKEVMEYWIENYTEEDDE